MEFKYKIEGNEYVLYDLNDKIILRSSYSIAMCYMYHEDDKEIKGTLLKHGSKENVYKYYQNALKKYKDSGFQNFANSLKYIHGRIPLDEINRCIQCTGYVGKFHEKMMSNQISIEESIHPDIDEFF